jgi:hypothetical protein
LILAVVFPFNYSVFKENFNSGECVKKTTKIQYSELGRKALSIGKEIARGLLKVFSGLKLTRNIRLNC